MSRPNDREQRLAKALKEVIEAGDGIRCYPSGAAGFEEWYEAQEKAQAVLNEFLDEDGNWHRIDGSEDET